jgi:tRNA (guanine37-N1)-methyltransferase
LRSVEILTLFPNMVRAPLEESILGKAQARGLLSVAVTDVRSFAMGKHHVTDDSPYGGGAGMVMKVEPLVAAIESARAKTPGVHVVLLWPRGRKLTQEVAKELSRRPALALVCGRYEGVDERVTEHVDEEISLGDFVLSGGELAAMCVVDAVARLMPGVLGNEASTGCESFENGVLEYPQYTRPQTFRGSDVPEVLLSGDHRVIARWRRARSLALTRRRRPDLFAQLALSEEDDCLLAEVGREGEGHARQDS